MKAIFKKHKDNSLCHYFYVSNYQFDNPLEDYWSFEEHLEHPTSFQQDYIEDKLNFYLHWAFHLVKDLKKFAIVKYFPEVENKSMVEDYRHIRWEYEVLSNDYDGIGIDNGFKHIGHESKGAVKHYRPAILIPLNRVEDLKHLPGDIADDAFENISIFGLKKGRGNTLVKLLQDKERPALESFLEEEEIFLNMVVGKEQGYFDSFLVKSKSDLEEAVSQLELVAKVK